MPSKHIVTMDLGATKCAAGVISYHPETHKLECERTCSVLLDETTSLKDMISQIEYQLMIPFREADAVCIGAAGQYNGHELCHLAGVYPYRMMFADLAKTDNWPAYAVLHDYDPVVCATFTDYMQHPQHFIRLNDCVEKPHQRRVALGLGTGVGLKDGVLLPNGDFWLGKNEMGHIGIVTPPRASKERLQQHQAFMRFLQDRQQQTQEQISFESALTGRGLVNLHQFLYGAPNTPTPDLISEKMRTGQAPELLDLLAWYLGLFVGTVQLTFLPEGGIWITGGVVIKNLEIFKQASFEEGINDSPAYLQERKQYAMGVMVKPEHALIGAGYYAIRKLL